MGRWCISSGGARDREVEYSVSESGPIGPLSCIAVASLQCCTTNMLRTIQPKIGSEDKLPRHSLQNPVRIRLLFWAD